jgi:hypothetical protein
VIYIIYVSEGERAERVIAVVVHKSTVRSVVTKMVCRDRFIALNLKALHVRLTLICVTKSSAKHSKMFIINRMYHFKIHVL